MIIYKKTGEWYIEWQRVVQRVTTSGTTTDNEWYNDWQRMATVVHNDWQRMITSDNKMCNKWQRMTTSGTTSDNEWKTVASNDEKWQRVAILAKLPFFKYYGAGMSRSSFHYEVTADSSNRCIQNLCKFIKEYYCGISEIFNELFAFYHKNMLLLFWWKTCSVLYYKKTLVLVWRVRNKTKTISKNSGNTWKQKQSSRGVL